MSGATDLLAHLRPCPVVVTFDGFDYTIPAMDAIEWIVRIDGEAPDLYAIFPTLAGTEAIEHVEDALWDGRATSEDVGKIGLYAIGAAADRPWWVTLRIIHAATSAWDVVHVNRAAGMSLAGWLDEVWSRIMERIDPKKKAGWLSEIESTPEGWESEVDFDDEERAFMAAMKAVM